MGVGFLSLSSLHSPGDDGASSVFLYVKSLDGRGLKKEHGGKYLVVCVLETYFIMYSFP